MKKQLMFIVVLVLSPLTASAATVTLFDGDFLDADYDVSLLGTTNGGNGSASTIPAGGLPGAFRQLLHTASDPRGRFSASTVWNINTTLTHNPSVDGAIASLNYSEDNLAFASQAFSGAVAVRQDGFLYRSAETFVTTDSNSTWFHQESNGLTASDFELHFVDPNSGQVLVVPTANPNFSESGSEIEFGFWRQTGGTSFGRNGGLDNLTFVLTTVEVPEPTSIALLILSAVCLVGIVRTR